MGTYWRSIPSWLRTVVVIAVYTLLWLALDLLTLVFETAPEVVLFYPPAALDMALLLGFGLRYLPAMLIPTTIDGLFIPPVVLPSTSVMVYVIAKFIIYGGAAAFLLQRFRIDPELSRLRDVAAFVTVASLLAPLLFGLVTITDLVTFRIIPWSEWVVRVLHFWVGYSIGIVALAPFLLVWIIPALRHQRKSTRLRVPNRLLLQMMVEAIAIALGTWIAFAEEVQGYQNFLYVCFLPMIWVAVRYGFKGATLAVLVINFGAAFFTLYKQPGLASGLNLARVQFCMLAVSQTALLLGSTITRRMQAMVELRQRMQQERLLNQILQALNSTLNPEAILQQIVKLTGESFAVDRVVVWRIDGDQVQVLHEWRANPRIMSMLDVQLSRSDWFDHLDVDGDRFQRTPFQCQDYSQVSHTPARDALIQAAQIHSILRVPIFIQDEFFGSISLHTLQERVFHSGELSLLEQIAQQTAIALYNAHSYERLEQQVQERTCQLEREKLMSEAANQAKSEFLNTMSHELRTPLTSVIGCSSVLLEQIFGPLNDRQQQYIRIVHRSGQQLLELINDVLDLARIEAGREDLQMQTIAIDEIAQSCISTLHEQAQRKQLTLALDIAPNLATCWADERRLRQILLNLLSNAVKFTDAGSVRLQVRRVEAAIEFRVQDTGIGISEADLSRLFQPFEQLESGMNRRYQGTGLGLALSQRLAQLMGGKITIESQPGQGSCFTLHLPATAVE